MRSGRLLRAAAGLLLTLAAGACASARGGAGAASAGSVTVDVRNNLTPPTSVSVRVVPENGVGTLLGSVGPSGTARFSFDPALATGRYRLVARTTAGTDIDSNPFTLGEGEVATWDMQANLVTVGS